MSGSGSGSEITGSAIGPEEKPPGLLGGPPASLGGFVAGWLVNGSPGGPPGPEITGLFAKAGPARAIVMRSASRNGAALRSRGAKRGKKCMVYLLPENTMGK